MTLTRLNEIPGLKVGDRVVCTSTNGHSDDLPRPWWTVGKTYTVEQVDEPYQPFVRADDGSLSGAVFGYFATAPRETVEDRPVTLTEGWGPWRTDISEWNVTTHDVRFECIGGIHKISLRPRAAAEAHLRGEPEGAMRCAECDCKNGGAECTWIATPAPDPADQAELIASLRQVIADMEDRGGEPAETFYIDCEFDGHNGPLLSIAMVRGDGWSLHVEVADVAVEDPWVLANVVPILGAHRAEISCRVRPHEVGRHLRFFIGDCRLPTIIADSPVDIGRFCRAISTGADGGWASADYPGMTFIVRNVNCYPTQLEGAVQHNAWWDAMALRALISAARGETQ